MRWAPPILLGAVCTACVSIPFDAPAGPYDGQGTLTITPQSVEASTETLFRLTYTAGASGLFAGGGFRVELPTDPIHRFMGFTPPHTGFIHLRGHVRCQVLRGERVSEEAVAMTGEGGIASCLLGEGKVGAGEALIMEYWGLAPRVAGSYELHAESRISGGHGGRPLDASPALAVVARAARSLHAVLPSVAAAGEPMTLALVALDEFGNRARDYAGSVAVRLGEARMEHRFQAEEQGVALLTGLALWEQGFARALVTEQEAGGYRIQTRSNPVRVLSSSPGRVLWGDLHFHTGGGAGRPAFRAARECAGDHRGNYTRQADAYAYALHAMRLDFAAATEHATRAFTDEAWDGTLMTAARWHQPPRFTTLVGFQWNDRLVLLPGASGPLVRSDRRDSDEPGELGRALRDHDAVIVSAGEAAARGDSPVAEIYSWRNRGEGYDDEPRRLEPGPWWLAGGHDLPVSVIASSANHWGHPGSVDLTGLEPGSGGLTAVVARENGREAILEALRQGRAWATTGARIYLSLRREGPRLEIQVAGTAGLARVDLVVVQRWSAREISLPASGSEDLRTVIPVPEAEGKAFCYLRVEQEDSEMAWSSPLPLEPDRDLGEDQ